MDGLNNRNNWIIGKCNNILNHKDKMLEALIFQMLNKTTQMFEYKNLPETIPYKDLETQLQVNGFAIWHEVHGKLYTFTGGLGGTPNVYYLPTIATVANPALKFSKNLAIDTECVVMLNDHYYQGLMPLFNKYGNLLVEAELSLKYAIINARVPALVQADNDNTHKSAEEFFQKIIDGKEYGVIASKEFFDGIRTQDFYKQAYIKDLIEAIQYIKGSWYNEIGLNAVFNMKREAINEAEATLNEDILYPTPDTMLKCRRDALEKVNSMYGTDITVDFTSVWKNNRVMDDLTVDLKQAEVKEVIVDDTTEIDDVGDPDKSGSS